MINNAHFIYYSIIEMNVYFTYRTTESYHTVYGKYYGYVSDAVSEEDFLNAIFPSLQQCYSIENMNKINIRVLPHYSATTFSELDPFKYDFVYCNTSPPHFYWYGTRID